MHYAGGKEWAPHPPLCCRRLNYSGFSHLHDSTCISIKQNTNTDQITNMNTSIQLQTQYNLECDTAPPPAVASAWTILGSVARIFISADFSLHFGESIVFIFVFLSSTWLISSHQCVFAQLSHYPTTQIASSSDFRPSVKLTQLSWESFFGEIAAGKQNS